MPTIIRINASDSGLYPKLKPHLKLLLPESGLDNHLGPGLKIAATIIFTNGVASARSLS